MKKKPLIKELKKVIISEDNKEIKVILAFIDVILAAMLIKHIFMGYLNSGTF